MNKQIFRKGDRVFDIRHGWGEVTDAEDKEIYIKYKNCSQMYSPSNIGVLSFTEYTLKGFTQERPVNYEEYIGKWGKFWNDNPKYFTIGILEGYEQGGHKPFQSVSLDFQNFQPLTDEQIKTLNLE